MPTGIFKFSIIAIHLFRETMRWVTISRIDSKNCDYESRILILSQRRLRTRPPLSKRNDTMHAVSYDFEVILRSFFVEKSDEFLIHAYFNYGSNKPRNLINSKRNDRCTRSVKNRYYIGRGKWKRNKPFNTRLNDFVGPENGRFWKIGRILWIFEDGDSLGSARHSCLDSLSIILIPLRWRPTGLTFLQSAFEYICIYTYSIYHLPCSARVTN